MARAAKVIKTTKVSRAVRKTGRAAAVADTSPKRVTPLAVPPKRFPITAAATPKLSKDELRAQVEKLEQANATLRAKGREANRAAKANTARIADLEDQVNRLEKQAKTEAAPVKSRPRSSTPGRVKRSKAGNDPGDALPAGVAVQEPAGLKEDADTTLQEDAEAE